MKTITARTKLLMALTVILGVAFLGVSLVNYAVTRNVVRKEIIENDLPLTRDNIYSEISIELARPTMVASSMANDAFLKDWAEEGEKDTGKIVKYLRATEEKYGFFSTFFVSAVTGRYYHYTGLHKVISDADAHDIWFFRFVTSGREHALDVDTDEASNDILTIFINYRVENARGELLGVTGVGLKMDAVTRMVQRYREKYDRLVYLVGPTGLVMVHPDLKLVEKRNIYDIPEMKPLAEDMLDRKRGPANYEFKRDGRSVIASVRYMPEMDCFIFVEQDETKSLVTARMNFLRTVVFGLAASAVIIILTLATINRYQSRVETMAVTDELTGAANRRRLESEFERFLYQRRRHGRPFSLLLLDMDGFKAVNDSVGHLAGDQLLVQVAGIVSEHIRPSDLLARWGGDEFAILAEGGVEEAAAMAERLLRSVNQADLAGEEAGPDDPRRRLSLSAGLVECRDGDDLDSLIRRADAALYACKAEGGNTCRTV